MYKFSDDSLAKLMSCEDDLHYLFNSVVKKYDCKILEGFRSNERQLELFEEGASRVKESLHNHYPSLAVDVSPYPIPDNWGEGNSLEKAKFYHFAGYVLKTAQNMGIEVRWGGDWDGDLDFDDQTFNDLVHWELV